MTRIDQFTLTGFLFGLLLLGAVSGLILDFSGDMFNSYNQTVDDSELTKASERFNDNVNKDIEDTRQQASQIGDGIAANLFFIPAVWDMISTALTAFPVLENAFTDLSTVLPIPGQAQDIVVGFVVIGLMYAGARFINSIR